MKTDFSIKIGSRIKYFRELNGLSQLELAELIPCEPSTLAHYETGKNLVSMTRFKRIAEVLKIDAYKLLLDRIPNGNKKTIEDIEKLLLTANDTQLGLIYSTISGILDLTTLED